MRKGQGAFEYIMTYGWAIIIVIIVGIILYNSGVFGQATESQQGFIRIRPADFIFGVNNASVNGTSTIVWDNVAGQSLKDVNITYDGDQDGVFEDQGFSGNIKAGKRETDSLFISSLECGDGDAAVVDAKVSYRTEAGVTRTETGTIRGTCSA
ncbi:MAG: hypothetical protein J4432_05365 [DPANN group archaeon]|nr:hypothetical protein [DPANN group archaeon]